MKYFTNELKALVIETQELINRIEASQTRSLELIKEMSAKLDKQQKKEQTNEQG